MKKCSYNKLTNSMSSLLVCARECGRIWATSSAWNGRRAASAARELPSSSVALGSCLRRRIASGQSNVRDITHRYRSRVRQKPRREASRSGVPIKPAWLLVLWTSLIAERKIGDGCGVLVPAAFTELERRLVVIANWEGWATWQGEGIHGRKK